MKINNKTRYGIQFMLNLAINYGEDFINIKDIAVKENISVKFLENIVSIIKPGNLIKVKRGSSGGYKLAKTPSEITLYEIIDLLEGEVMPAEQSVSSNTQISDIAFITNKFLLDINNNFSSFLKSITLEDLVKEYRKKQDNFMFYI